MGCNIWLRWVPWLLLSTPLGGAPMEEASTPAANTPPTLPSTMPSCWLDMDLREVRNTGSSGGEQGYIRLQRDDEAQCGTDSSPMDGTACEGGPGNDVQHVCGECGVLFDCSWPLGAHEWTEP